MLFSGVHYNKTNINKEEKGEDDKEEDDDDEVVVSKITSPDWTKLAITTFACR